MPDIPFSNYRIEPESRFNLLQIEPDDDGGLSKKPGKAEFKKLRKQLIQLQDLLFAEKKHALLVVFQAIDTGGKDSTIRHVFKGVNPQGCRVSGFKAPTEIEQEHDFLWRIHQKTPPLGYIEVFSRSHYEDVLVARVKQLVPKSHWQKRYGHINNFERLLLDEGTAIVKFFLHISKDYQKRRLERRLQRPDKHWKFDPTDVAERQHWHSYQQAFEDMLNHCSTPEAPWYVIPAEHHWYRNLLVANVLVDKLKSFQMEYPSLEIDPTEIVIN